MGRLAPYGWSAGFLGRFAPESLVVSGLFRNAANWAVCIMAHRQGMRWPGRKAGAMAADPGNVAAAADAIPRDYNFADDLFRRFAEKGWLGRTAYIDPRGSWTYGQLTQRARQFSAVLTEKGIQPGERVLMCLTDTIDWPAVFLGTVLRRSRRGAGQHADDRRRLPLHAGRLRRAHAGGLAGAAAEIREARGRTAGLSPGGRRQPRRVAASGSRLADRRRRWRANARRRRPATVSRSGSTPRARPASRRRRCMCMPTSS